MTVAPALAAFTASVPALTRVYAPTVLSFDVGADVSVAYTTLRAFAHTTTPVSATVTRPVGQPEVGVSRCHNRRDFPRSLTPGRPLP